MILDVWSMACLLVPYEPQHSEFTIATIQEGKHPGKNKAKQLAYIDILVNLKIRPDSVKRMTQIQNTS